MSDRDRAAKAESSLGSGGTSSEGDRLPVSAATLENAEEYFEKLLSGELPTLNRKWLIREGRKITKRTRVKNRKPKPKGVADESVSLFIFG